MHGTYTVNKFWQIELIFEIQMLLNNNWIIIPNNKHLNFTAKMLLIHVDLSDVCVS